MHFFSLFTFMTLLHVLIIIAVSIRVIQVRLPVAASLAWLLLVFFLPFVGAVAYLVLGEKRLGRKFTERTQAIKGRYDSWLQDLPPEIRSARQELSPEARSLSRLAETTVNIPATIPGWCTSPVDLTSMICWPPASEFSDLEAGCCTPKALSLIGKLLCSARSTWMSAVSGWILRSPWACMIRISQSGYWPCKISISRTQYLWICKPGSSDRAKSALSKTWRGLPARFFKNYKTAV